MAYRSSVSGRAEIYVERYPELGQRQLISTGDGARMPVWSPDGKELFFGTLSGRQMLRVAIQSGLTLILGRPRDCLNFPCSWRKVGGRMTSPQTDGS